MKSLFKLIFPIVLGLLCLKFYDEHPDLAVRVMIAFVVGCFVFGIARSLR